MNARLKPLQPLSTQEFTDVSFCTPFDACVALIFRAHFCAAIKIELLAPTFFMDKKRDVAICYFLPAETEIFHTGYV